MGDVLQEWSKSDIRSLKKAISEVGPDIDKNERFKQISARLGGHYSKKECYRCYKALKAEKKKRTESYQQGQRPKSSAAEPSDKVERSSKLDSERPTVDTLPLGGDVFGTSYGRESQDLPSTRSVESFSSEVSSVRRRKNSSSVNSWIEEAIDPISMSGHSNRGSIHSWAPSEVTEDTRLPITTEITAVEEVEDFDMAELEGDEIAMAVMGHRPSSAATGSLGSGRGTSIRCRGRPIDVKEANGLRELIFGDPKKHFNDAWCKQGFFFNETSCLRYGLMQHAGGPCGAIAAVQAFILDYLLFGAGRQDSQDWESISAPMQSEALLNALTRIIWRARAKHESKAVLALGGQGAITSLVRSAAYRPDGFTENLVIYEVATKTELKALISGSLADFKRERGLGVVLLVYSCILTRGIDQAIADMDQGFEEAPTLIAQHGYASQELVNLFLIGAAHTNVFDNEKMMDDSVTNTSDVVKLRGIPARGRVGFLTLFESYGYMQVGSHLKDPEVSIWMVCSESHYSTLFSPSKNLLTAEASSFDLYYYDELANQKEVIRLSVNRFPADCAVKSSSEDDLTPPLDMVIRTKWEGASVDWNGIEPIL